MPQRSPRPWRYENQSERREPGMILKTEISSVCFLKTTENLYRFDNFLYTYFDGIYLPHWVLSVFQSWFASLQTWISGLRMSIWAAGGAKSPTIMRYEVAFRQSVRNYRLIDAGAVSRSLWKKDTTIRQSSSPSGKNQTGRPNNSEAFHHDSTVLEMNTIMWCCSQACSC